MSKFIAGILVGLAISAAASAMAYTQTARQKELLAGRQAVAYCAENDTFHAIRCDSLGRVVVSPGRW